MMAPLKERILEKVYYEPNTGCWIWGGGISKNGYGVISVEGKSAAVHRESYKVFKGSIPKNNVIRHICDNKWCVNPSHLEVGFQADNIQDMLNKCREAKGEKQGLSVLTDDMVKEMKATPNFRGRGSYFSKKFNVDKTTVSCVFTGKTWRHL